MANEEYRQLVGFLTREFGRLDARFAQIDERFAQVDARFAQVDAQLVAVRREVGETRRDLRGEIHDQGETFGRQLAEFRRDVDERFDEVKGLIRVRRLEDRG